MAHPGTEWYYAVKNYTGTSEEQLTVVAGEPLHLLDDSDNEWWYAISPRTEQAGYLPALFIETTMSRIGRVNAVKNKKLLIPSSDETNMTTTCSHQKKIQFAMENQVLIFDDDPDETGTITRQDSDPYMAHGLIRVYAGIWDLEVTYKVIKIGPQMTTEECIRAAVSKFLSVKNPDAPSPDKLAQSMIDLYSLYITSGMEERKFTPDEFPLKELERLGLDDEQKKLVKFQLKKSVEMDGVPLRVYSEENLFKTIIVGANTTVADAIKNATAKFKGGKPELYLLRMVAGGKEVFLENESNLHEILATNKKEGNADNQKFYLSRRRVSVDPSEQSVLRVYGGALDLDVAYRALFVNVNTTAEQVVAQVLEKYNSRDPPKDYNLSIQPSTPGAVERTLDKTEKPLEILRAFEKEHAEGHLKFLLKKGTTAPKTSVPTIKLTKIPVRIYCDFITKGGAASSKPVLVSENMTTSSVVFLAIEKFNIKSNLTIQDYTLYIINDDTGIIRHLSPDDLPLVVKNELGKKVSFHLAKSEIKSDQYAVRIHPNKVWPEETLKTIFVTKTVTAGEAIAQTMEKFKHKGVTAEMFEIIRVHADGSEIPNEKSVDGNALPFKDRAEDFALVKKSTFKEGPSTPKAEEQQETEYSAKLFPEDPILTLSDENLADVEIGDLDSALANLSDNISHLLKDFTPL